MTFHARAVSTAAADDAQPSISAADGDSAAAAAASTPREVGEAPHVPVLMRQVLECFQGVRLRAYVDGTMGAGGHASAVVRAHPEMQTFVGFDVDPLAHDIARPRRGRSIGL